MTELASARVLVVGVGGLAAPAARVLAESGVGHMTLLDDDRVDVTNLHRQVLFEPSDAGSLKVEAATRVLSSAAPGLRIRTVAERLLPETAREMVAAHDLVLDGTDNLASKFLVADAARLAGVPAVHAGVVRWTGWALSAAAGDGPCMRCVFEDLPRDRVETCAGAGVVGPVVGVVGALEALLALRLLRDGDAASGTLYSYDALGGRLRSLRVRRRAGCPLCDGHVAEIELSRYIACRPSPDLEIPCP